MGRSLGRKERGLCAGILASFSDCLFKFSLNKPIVKRLSLGIFRSDYMVHEGASDPLSDPQIKQVEFNTIASSFGGLASKVSALHRFVVLKFSLSFSDPIQLSSFHRRLSSYQEACTFSLFPSPKPINDINFPRACHRSFSLWRIQIQSRSSSVYSFRSSSTRKQHIWSARLVYPPSDSP